MRIPPAHRPPLAREVELPFELLRDKNFGGHKPGLLRVRPWADVPAALQVEFLHLLQCEYGSYGYLPLFRAREPSRVPAGRAWVHVDRLGPTAEGVTAVIVVGDPLPTTPELRAQIRHATSLYEASVSPRYTDLRRWLEACALAGRVIVLVGPPAPVDALVRLVWTVNPRTALVLDEPPAEPREWLYVSDLARADPTLREVITTRLRADPPAAYAAGRAARPSHPAVAHLVGTDPSFVRALHRALEVAPLPAPVLVEGEPGTGRCSLSRVIHTASGRPGRRQWLPAGASVEELRSTVEACEGGTLGIAELQHLGWGAQEAVLEILRVGTVRVVATTSRSIEAEAGKGRVLPAVRAAFSTHRVWMPPLRSRIADAVAIARSVDRVYDPPHHRILARRWPGNVTELLDALEATFPWEWDGDRGSNPRGMDLPEPAPGPTFIRVETPDEAAALGAPVVIPLPR